MSKKTLITSAIILSTLLLLVPNAYNNASQAPAGYSGAPGEQTCAASGCHTGVPQSHNLFTMGVSGGVTAYQTSTQYNLFVSASTSAPIRGFQFTAVYDNGTKAGTLSLSNASLTTLTTGANGREYVGHNGATSNSAWAFRWTAPSTYNGTVYFYGASLAADGDNTSAGDFTYTLFDSLPASQLGGGGVVADFAASVDTVCVGESVTFTDASTGAVSSYVWDFGTDADPATASTVGPHTVSYSTSGSKTIELIVGDGSDYDTTSAIVYVNATPNVYAGMDIDACLGDTAYTTASGADTYTWNIGATGASISGALQVPGVFPLAVTGVDTTTGCAATDTLWVNVSSPPAVSLPDTTSLCGSSNTTLDAGSYTGATYLWSTTETSQTINVTTPGNYYVTVTVGACETVDTAVIVGGTIAVSVADASVCAGNSTTLDAGSFAGATYLWSTNETTQTISVSSTGTYSVTVTQGACSGADTATVSSAVLPPVGAGADQTICFGDFATIGDPDSVGGLVPIQVETFNGCGLPSGWSTVAVTGSDVWAFGTDSDRSPSSINGSCMAFFNDDAVGFVYNNTATLESPAVDVTSYGGVYLVLDHVFRQYSATAPDYYSIEVFDGASYQTIFTTDQSYNNGSVEYTGAVRDTFDLSPYINANLKIRFTFDDGDDWVFYAGIDNFVLLGIPSSLYTWTPTTGVVNPTSPVTAVSPATTTTYVLTASAGGCSTSDTVVVTVNPSPTVSVTGLTGPYCIDDTNGMALTLSPTGGTLTGAGLTGEIFRASDAGAGTHHIVYEYFDNGLGCTGRDTLTVTVNPLPSSVITNLPHVFCIDDAALNMTGSPAGGTFAGPGVTGATFDPSVAGAGAHTIAYTYADGIGCSYTFERDIEVVEVTVSFTGLDVSYCAGVDVIDTLVPSIPGGTFSGPGIINGNEFSSAAAGGGTHTITYSYDTMLYYSVNEFIGLDTVPGSGSGTTYTFSSVDESLSDPIEIGFNFDFFGTAYDSFIVSTNGWLSFDLTTTSSDLSNDVLPSTNGVEALIAYMWDDMETNSFEYYTVGTAPNRQFVINFYETSHYGNNEPVDAQVVLYETTNVIEIYCVACNEDASGTSATQGIENEDGTVGFNTPGRANSDWEAFNEGVRFSPVTACSAVTTQTVTVDGAYITTNDTTVCAGQIVSLVAAGGTSYTWSTGATGSLLNVTPTDTSFYTVTGTSAGGCTSTDTVWVFVNPTPDPQIGGLNSIYCSNDAPVTLTTSPAGGTLYGSGINGNTFTPTGAPTGTPFPITYTVTNSYGCADSMVMNIEVLAAPQANITSLSATYCIDEAAVTLAALPAGGTFSGAGVSGNTFVPFYAGVGVHDIYYRVPVGGSCFATDTFTVEVLAAPTVSFDPIAATYCVNSGIVTLVGTPAGGTFSGPGVSGNTFDPAAAGVGGPYILFYNYTDANGCSNAAVQVTEVTELPTLSWVGLQTDHCTNDDFVILQATPTGGSFSGQGVNGNAFYPANLSAGTYTLTYTYTAGGCTNTLSTDVIVNEAPFVTVSDLNAAYCANDDLAFIQASPEGGTFSGLGVVGNVFTPATAGAGGPYTVTYTYTDSVGCTSNTSVDVTVYPFANAVINGLSSDFYCIEEDAEYPVSTFPSGGVLTGAGISNGSFNPSRAGAGAHTLQYEFENNNGCISYTDLVVEVYNCTGIEDVESLGDVSVYPNPTTGQLYISFNNFVGKELKFELFNMQGQLLIDQKIIDPSTNLSKQIDLSGFAEGVYLVKVSSTNKSFVTRVVLQK